MEQCIIYVQWQKLDPPPNISCRYFVHSTETILSAKKDLKNAKHKFNYNLMHKLNEGKQAKDVWQSSLIKTREKKFGKHPKQKPIGLDSNGRKNRGSDLMEDLVEEYIGYKKC